MNRKESLKNRHMHAVIRKLEAEIKLIYAKTISEKIQWGTQLLLALMTITASYFAGAAGSTLPTSTPPRPPEEEPMIEKEDPDHVRSYILKTVEWGRQAVKRGQDVAAVRYEMINELKLVREEQTVHANREMIDHCIRELGKISVKI